MSEELCFAFVDLAGYTALTAAHGDTGAADVAARFYELAAASVDGETRVVKHMGDAVMLVSRSTRACIGTVLRMFELASAEKDFLGLRAGLNAGSVIERDGDFFGATVNLGARLCAHARGGQILCGASVAHDAAHVAGVDVMGLGRAPMKNVKDEVQVFALVDASSARAPYAPAVDPICRMCVTGPAPSVVHDGATYRFCSEECAAQFRSSPERWVPRGA